MTMKRENREALNKKADEHAKQSNKQAEKEIRAWLDKGQKLDEKKKS